MLVIRNQHTQATPVTPNTRIATKFSFCCHGILTNPESHRSHYKYCLYAAIVYQKNTTLTTYPTDRKDNLLKNNLVFLSFLIKPRAKYPTLQHLSSVPLANPANQSLSSINGLN